MKGSLIVGVALMLGIGSACAADYKVGDLEIGHPWSRATPKSAKVASGYLSITNTGSAADRLVSGTFAQSHGFQIHEMSMDGGVMKMRELKALDIKPGQTVELKPSSSHLMFTDLNKPLAVGQRVKGTLVFENAGSVAVDYTVEAIGATSPKPDGQ